MGREWRHSVTSRKGEGRFGRLRKESRQASLRFSWSSSLLCLIQPNSIGNDVDSVSNWCSKVVLGPLFPRVFVSTNSIGAFHVKCHHWHSSVTITDDRYEIREQQTMFPRSLAVVPTSQRCLSSLDTMHSSLFIVQYSRNVFRREIWQILAQIRGKSCREHVRFTAPC
jgi:hypothetical protein